MGRESCAGAKRREPQGVGNNKPNWYRYIIERLSTDRIEFSGAKRDRDKGNPEHGGDRDWVQELAEMEGSSQESICSAIGISV